MKKILWLVIFSFCLSTVSAANKIVDLHIDYKTVSFAGKSIQALAVNNQIPGPTLHFKEGDHVTLNVYNHLAEETAIHWHGMLIPWQMDGVLGVTQKGIPPGGVFHYQFTLNQSGTYWYHAHAGLQEQQGMYGAFLIDPLAHPKYQYNKDYVVVLSDWSNTHPNQILANLKKEGEYYSPRFPLQPSLIKFIHDYQHASEEERDKIIYDYKMMQHMRMSLYDLSDVAYDAFLLNGQSSVSPWTGSVKVGDVVRLRFIGAGGSTIFHVKIPGASMRVVHLQGNDIKPYSVNDFTIAPGETVDVLVRIQKNDPYIIYAESIDKVGAAYGALVTENHQFVNYTQISPFPEPLPAMRNTMSHAMHMDPNMPMHDGMTMSDDSSQETMGTKYQNLVAAVKTNNPDKTVEKVIKMDLFGYMNRFIWFINGVPEHQAPPIILEPNKRYRFVFTNPSMMHHPMHFHGHWFILRNGHGSYDPLLHTIDVPPGATVTADVDTDGSGQWLFHCHLLYHMMSGMSRVFQYTTLIEMTHEDVPSKKIITKTVYHNRPIVRVDVNPIDPMLVHHPMAHHMSLFLANFIDVGVDPIHDVQRVTFKGLYGRDYNKLELFVNDAEMKKSVVENADIDIFYWHLLDEFWSIKGGVNYYYRPAQTPYWQPGMGIEGLMPYFIDTDLRGYFRSGSAKIDVDLARDNQITNNIFIRTEVRGIVASKTVAQAEIGSGLNQMRYIIRPYYRLMPGLNIFAEYEHEQAYGSFKNMQQHASENTVLLGFSAIL